MNNLKSVPIRLRSVLSLGATLTLFLMAGACTKKDRYAGQNVMIYPLKDEVRTLDPANAYDSVSLEIVPNIYDRLYTYDYKAPVFKVIPQLAADMPKLSKDQLTLTIPLRHGVRFQDDASFKASGGKGREVKAQDYVYGMKRLAHPGVQSQGNWIFDGRVVGFSEFAKKLSTAPKESLSKIFEDDQIEGIKAVDDYTLELRLTRPYPQIMYMLSMPFTAPIAREAIAAYGDDKAQINDHAVGTGPFRLEKWERGQEVVLTRNENFRGDLAPVGAGIDAGKKTPFLDKVVFRIIKEEQPKWLSFLKGEVDATEVTKDNFVKAFDVKTGQLSAELKAKKADVDIVSGTVFYWLDFNNQDKLLSNKKVRQAISSAIDREKWIELFAEGRGHKATSAAPPGLADRYEGKIKYDLNLDRARELLKEAGYPEGKNLPTINLDMRGASSLDRQMGEYFTTQLAQVGIKLNVMLNTFPAFLEKQKQNSLQMSYGGWELDYPDVENVYQLLYGKNVAPGPNSSNFNLPAFNSLYEKLSSLQPGPARAAVVKEMEGIIQEECPWAFGFYRDEYRLSQGWIQNYHAQPFVHDSYRYYRMDQVLKKQILTSMK